MSRSHSITKCHELETSGTHRLKTHCNTDFEAYPQIDGQWYIQVGISKVQHTRVWKNYWLPTNRIEKNVLYLIKKHTFNMYAMAIWPIQPYEHERNHPLVACVMKEYAYIKYPIFRETFVNCNLNKRQLTKYVWLLPGCIKHLLPYT